ncbi:AAA family ATPase [Methanobrevibacter sp.]|uniref:AAA family ATPase n=1 Tax=Methanobrevibacter sp. TaxID=66852 RepID=UPI00386CBC1E
MSRCPECNALIGANDEFCPNCGLALKFSQQEYEEYKLSFYEILDHAKFLDSNQLDNNHPIINNWKSRDLHVHLTMVNDMIDFLAYLSFGDRMVSDAEINFVNDLLGTDMTKEGLMSVAPFRTSIDLKNLQPMSFVFLHEIDLAMQKQNPSDFRFTDHLYNIYVLLGGLFIDLERIATDREMNMYYEYVSQLEQYIIELKTFEYENMVKSLTSTKTGNQEPIYNFNEHQNNIEVNNPNIIISQNQNDDDGTLDEYITELNKLIGLESVKNDVNSLINLIQVRQVREQRGMKQPPMSLHLVFSGNPGTGKTTVARLLSKIYHKMGLLSKGHLIETDRSGLVGGYVGQTAIKTQDVIQSAMGGILFIDEAYTLSSSKGEQDYGQESIDTILKAMEDNRDDLIVIVAGYPDLMQEFLQSNPGLQSRFNKFIFFEDYKPEELYNIFKLMCDENNLILDDKADEFVKTHFIDVYNNRGDNFANGREVRNLFENVLTNQANRLASNFNVSDEELSTLKYEDFK